jgi:hypothetical protein
LFLDKGKHKEPPTVLSDCYNKLLKHRGLPRSSRHAGMWLTQASKALICKNPENNKKYRVNSNKYLGI